MKIYNLGDEIPWEEIRSRELTPEEYQEAIALARAAFAADRLDDCDLDSGVPAEQVLAEMEAIIEKLPRTSNE